MNKGLNKQLYKTNKKAKVGEFIECPVCHTKFKKVQWSQAFDNIICKNTYHNKKQPNRHKNGRRYYREYNYKRDNHTNLSRVEDDYDLLEDSNFGIYPGEN